MNNLKSYTEYAVSTPTTDFVIGFDFNYGTDAVNVTVDDAPATEAGYSVIYLNSTTMRLDPAVPTGVVRLQRETDIDVPDNQFTAGAKFIASNMDENFTQIRHAQQEVRDGFGKLSEDTYGIIDTLQVVGQAAQDAADAAEQAAQTANDAAAQVNDKVSYQDLDTAVDTAVQNTVAGGLPATVIKDASGKDQQEINDKLISRLLSSFGAVPNDPVLASTNEAAIISAIQSGGDIIVDGFYYTTFSSTNTISSAFKLIAQQKGDGLYFTSTSSGGWLKLDNIDFAIFQGLAVRSNSGLIGTIATPSTDSTLISEFGLIDCDYDTGIRAFYGVYTPTKNPAVTPYGIKRVSLLGNSCTNVGSLFTAIDMPHDLLDVDGNDVRNLGSILINVSRGNTHSFPNELKASMKRGVFNNNTLINDDSYFATGVGTYLAFALYEGTTAEKKSNWVEGLKTRENAAVYDFYINSDELVSHKNTSKNNMCLNAQKTNNELMKSKGTYISRYSWDTFIVEKSFLQRHNALQDGMDWVTLYEKTSGDDNSNHIMEDCTVDVYAWLGLTSSTMTKGLTATRNTFIAEKAASNLFHINNIADGITTYADATVDVYGNIFKIKNLGGSITRNGQAYTGCTILRMNYNSASGKGIYKFVGCHDNDFDVDAVTGISGLVAGVAAEALNVGGNTFNVTAADTDRFRFLYSPATSVGSNNSLANVIRVKTGYLQDFGLAATLSPDKMSSLSARVESAYRPWYTNIIASGSKNMFATPTLRALSATGVWSATYNIKITPTGVEYTDVADDVVKTAPYPASGTLVINPKVVAVNASDRLMTGVRVTLYPVGTAAGEVAINWRFDGISNGSPVKLDVDLDVFGY